EVIADITEHEIDLIEIGKMIDDFRPVCCGGTGRLRRGGYRKDGTSAGKHGSQNFASMHRQFPYQVWVEYYALIQNKDGPFAKRLPIQLTLVQLSAAFTRSRVSGSSRIRLPVALAKAFAIAATAGPCEPSPAPSDFSAGRSMSSTSTCGTSCIVKIG